MADQWIDSLQAELVQQLGKNKGNKLAKKYTNAFPATYKEDFNPKEALVDIALIEQLNEDHPLEISLYEQYSAKSEKLYLKFIQLEHPIPLSDVLPMLENMDLRTFSERPYKITINHSTTIWISDFSVIYKPASVPILDVHKIFREALLNISSGICENDGFNKLIIGSKLPWQEIVILRAYAKYLHQIGFRYSQTYIERTLASYPEITKKLISLFITKFNPDQLRGDKAQREEAHSTVKKALSQLDKDIKDELEKVTSLDQDRILRNVWLTIKATLRTNYFQTTQEGGPKDYLSLKFSSKLVPDLPLPRPLYEIFVYSPRFEAIHLRSAKVARGGIRWSDRREDFRTEILGLMKAQKVKNAIIVPSGAKGGFVLKALQLNATREETLAEGIRCYKSFMRGLLDITDNLKDGKTISPPNVVCYDKNDYYLVVAADKGTASFSDIANGIALEYNFWLGDAFASGGSTGYDHKKMAITARGVWESIKRHFRNLSINIKTMDFTVIGIGDLSGDVLGNGMTYSDHTKLIAAFDHRHIFLDPTPDPKISFKERQRIFKLSVSSWDDYNKSLISKGGGVFSRTLKSIPISPEVRKAFGISDKSLPPNDLIRAILKAPVDLLFNGGIGTYVKSTLESHADVGDKTNEFCRVNGNELRCRTVGEGGNLGFTQLGRVEYALHGGLIDTDFIDNSAGVDCSDHEVNIKILLNKEVLKGKLTEPKRNELLVSMTEEVAGLVLLDNYNQALTMAIVTDHAPQLIGLYQAYLKELENNGVVDRAVEFLPDDKTILERKAAGVGLTSPELAVLLAYTKIHVKNEILKSDVPEEPYLAGIMFKSFPAILVKRYKNALLEHPLRREIIATHLSNRIVNMMGITFMYRLQSETGATVGEVIRAQAIASRIFGTKELAKIIDAVEINISAKMQYELLHHIRTLINLATRWFLQGNHMTGDIETIIDHYASRIKKLEEIVPDLMLGITKDYLQSLKKNFADVSLSEEIVRKVSIIRAIYTSLNIIEVATLHKFDLIKTAYVYFEVGGRFNLVWFRDQIAADKREGHWTTLARLTLRDELDALQKKLTVVIINSNKKENDSKILIDGWSEMNNRSVKRWDKVIQMLVGSSNIDYSMFFIAIKELSEWVDTSVHN